MSTELAFVGDIHGSLDALQGLWEALDARFAETPVVFLGDYINRGPKSADVLQMLISLAHEGRATLLAGNHETALLDALERSDLSAFLKIGGAMTIRSYVGGPVGPDVLRDFSRAFPTEHLEALRRMPLTFETADLIAQHIPPPPTPKYCISAHMPVGQLPRIGRRSASLDTGCGTGSGRLTALLWPSFDYIQVNSQGIPATG